MTQKYVIIYHDQKIRHNFLKYFSGIFFWMKYDRFKLRVSSVLLLLILFFQSLNDKKDLQKSQIYFPIGFHCNTCKQAILHLQQEATYWL